jgi:hypothetical protein
VALDLRKEPPKVPKAKSLAYGAMFGPSIKPGDYTVKIVKNDQVEKGSFTVKYNPDSRHSIEERNIRHEYVMKAYNLLEDLAFTVEKLNELKTECKEKNDVIEDEELSSMLAELNDSLSTIHNKLVSTENRGIFGSEEKLREKLANLYSSIIRYLGKPTQSQMDRLVLLGEEVVKYERQFNDLVDNKLLSINEKLKAINKPEIKLLTREEFENKDDS